MGKTVHRGYYPASNTNSGIVNRLRKRRSKTRSRIIEKSQSNHLQKICKPLIQREGYNKQPTDLFFLTDWQQKDRRTKKAKLLPKSPFCENVKRRKIPEITHHERVRPASANMCVPLPPGGLGRSARGRRHQRDKPTHRQRNPQVRPSHPNQADPRFMGKNQRRHPRGEPKW